MPNPKIASAVLCILVAITGMVQDLPWVTVTALVLWVISMAFFGFGSRSRFTLEDEEINRIKEEFKHDE